ncbi:AT-hook motif nuclear-localized protein 14 [Juglans microcarpa x Juglans regia]|uniref:AT-hook motif nuclear-localized protein 14 n=1 Tax=Juglans microcarpa x Juglans regia TaxID=2249226 RepID=UPI001B7F791A|nr:AT-hook motif nuclear-localized protein 14 [Juglans microcarpa x Juglans regia]
MEPSESQLSSYFRHHHHQNPITTTTNAAVSPTNGLMPPAEGGGLHMLYSHPSSVPSSAVTTTTTTTSSPLEGTPTAKRKRGRPRKYGTPEQALAAKKAAAQQQTTSSHSHSSKDKKDATSASSKKSHLVAPGNAGQGFTPHIITVAAGEDVGQKIMMFMQQSKRELCILSASGSISNASLRQPATSGGNIAYEGRFEIISLSGSYVRTELGGRTGGLSVCLSSTDGQIIGGGVGGPLRAAGPVQVIVGTFLFDTKKDINAGVKGDTSASKMPSPVGGAAVSSIGFRSAIDSSGRNSVRGNDEPQAIGGSHFMIQGMQMTTSRPTDWRVGPDARSAAVYELTGRTGHGGHQSPENGDYE